MILCYIILSLFWLACGIGAAYLAHTGLRHDMIQEGLPSTVPLGNLWVIWGPFLTGVVLLGAVALVCTVIIEWDRLKTHFASKA